MKISKVLIAISLALGLFGLARSACSEGTLVCQTTGDNVDTPLFCDVTNHYMLSTDGKTCEQKKVDGCEISAFDESTQPCMLCDAGKVYDTENKMCVVVAEDKKVENCDRYNAKDSTCSRCIDDHYLSVAEGKCLAVDTKVANCEKYVDQTTCESCKPDYYLKDGKCAAVPKVENCFKATDRVCEACEVDYSLNRGWNLEIPVNSGALSYLQGGGLTLSLLNQVNNEGSVCQKQILTNCLSYEAYNSCKVCSPDYFLNDTKKCERNPEKAILNCSKYSDNVTCSECKDNFYVSGSPTTCIAISVVENCGKYQVGLDKCLTCATGFYLNEGNNTCVDRTRKTIVNCTLLEPKLDACKTCEANFTGTTPAMHKCLVNVDNCKVGMQVNGGDSGMKHTCSECVDATFFIDEGLCKLRNVAHCGAYTGTTNNCATCSTDYWIDGNECKSVTVSNCALFTSNLNECTNCNTDYKRVDATTCTLNTISECTSYTMNTDTCLTCSGGKVVVGNACQVPSLANCQILKTGLTQCETCQTGYYPNGSGVCVEQAKTNCIDHKLNVDECKTCSLGYHLNSTSCSLNTQKNCATYTLNEDKCASCTKGYYWSGSACARQSVAGCVQYNDNLNTCAKCQLGKWLNSLTCDEVNVPNCIEYTTSTNECTKCAVTHYLSGSGVSATCEVRNKANCLTYDAGTNTCNSCVFGFEISTGSCVDRGSLNCVTMNASHQCTKCAPGYYRNSNACTVLTSRDGCMIFSQTEDKCIECDDGKYTVDSGLTCSSKSQTSCKTFTGPKTENKCDACDPLTKTKTNSGTGACDAISNQTDCYSSFGDAQDKCEQCVPGKYLSTDFCTGTGTSSNFDPNCSATKATDVATSCSVCASNYSVATGLVKQAADNVTNNCYQVNATTGVCDQCEPGYKLETNNSCTVYAGSVENALCNQHSSTDEKALTDATSCDVCRYPSLTYLTGNTCSDRGYTSTMKYCAVYDAGSAACLACDEDTVADVDVDSWGCDTDANVGSNTGCAVFGDLNKCKVCERGKVASTDDCIDATANGHIVGAYDEELSPAMSFNVTGGLMANCNAYSQIKTGVSMCSKCDSNYVAIVAYSSANTTLLNFGYVADGEGWTVKADIQNEAEKCLDGLNSYKKSTVKAITNTGECLVGFHIESNTTGYGCIQCVNGKVGEIDTVDDFEDDSTITSPKASIFNCVDQLAGTNAARLYGFMGDYKMDSNGYYLRFNAHFGYDSCVTSTSPTLRLSDSYLIYMMYPQPGGFMRHVTKKSSGGANPKQLYCTNSARIDEGQFCAFWILKADIADATFEGATHDYSGLTYCGACRPGFKPTYDGNNFITQCTQMATSDHDNTTANNIWMNRAAVATHGGWVWDPVANMIDFSMPLTSAQKTEKCVAYDTTNSVCVFCEIGWTVSDGKCSPANFPGGDCKGVYGMTKFQLATTELDKMKQMSNMLYLRLSVSSSGNFNTVTSVSPYCGTCGSGKKPRKISATQYKVCEKKTITGAENNCKYLDASDKTKCYECKATHTKNTVSSACVTKVSNCLEANNSGTCTKCDSGYALSGSSCVVANCKEWDPANVANCLICNDNKALDGSNTTHCSSSANSDTGCLNMSAVLGHCVKSAVSGKVPYIVKEKTGSGSTVKTTEHVTYTTTGNGYNNVYNDYLYVVIELDTINSNTVSGVLLAVETSKYKNAVYTKTLGNQPADNACLAARTLTNCATGHDGLYCKQCDGANMANDKGLCEAGNILNCAKYTGGTCSQCDDTRVLVSSGSGDGICKNNVRAVSDGVKCLTQKIDGDECLTCAVGKYLDSGTKACITNDKSTCVKKSITSNSCEECFWNQYNSSGFGCQSFSAPNCLTRNGTTMKCDSCAKGYSVDGVGGEVCNINTATFCEDWHATENKCSTCTDLFLQSASGATTGFCAKRAAGLCKTYNSGNDRCDTCETGFKVSGNDCVWGTAENCATIDPSNADQCSLCGSMYYKTGNTCPIRSAEGCKTFSSTEIENLCNTCGDVYWKSTQTCTRPTEKHCYVTKGSTDGCTTCLGGFDVNSGFTCDLRASGSCLTYTNDDKCASCVPGKYINVSGGCVENTAVNCATKSTVANECLTCTAGNWFDTGDSNKCNVNDAVNCLTKSTTVKQCTECASNYWMDSGDSNICKANDANNCLARSKTVNKCLTCNDQHYKDGTDLDKCKGHTAANCLTYHLTSDECLTCNANMLESINSGKKTCTAYTTLNCLTFSSVVDECATCTLATQYKHHNGSKIVCTARLLTNCETYNEGEDKCLTCAQKDYLVVGKCEAVTPVDQCKTYSIISNTCGGCEEGYYKSGSKNECWLYPDGIEGCVVYSSRTTCVACDDKSFLASNKCETVTTLVSDCKVYSSATDCQTCISGKFLVNNKCETITATNCLEYTDKATCKSCLAPYVFNTTNSKCESNGITGCAVGAYASSGNTCVKCDLGKVLSTDGTKCDSPTTTVSNCSEYVSLTKCKMCSIGYILNLEASQCDAIGATAGSNCSVASTLADHVCDLCRFGYNKDKDGKCVAIALDSCLIQSVDGLTCLFCAPSSYMTKEGKCTKPSDVVPTSSVGVFDVVFSMVLGWLIL